MSVRAKFMLCEHTKAGYGQGHSHTFVFRPVYDTSIPEDKRFATATPSGELRISVDNPEVIKQWENGQGTSFYLDFSEVKPE